MMRRIPLLPPRGAIGKSALVVLAAGVAAGCSADSSRFSDGRLFAGSTANQRAIITGSAAGVAVQPVAATGLAPTGQSFAADATRSEAGLSRGRWTTVNAPVVTVAQGETLTLIAQRHGVPVDVIVTANRLPGPQSVRPGQSLIIPAYVYNDAEAAVARPLETTPAAPAAEGTLGQIQIAEREASVTEDAVAVNAGGTHVVEPGETIWSVARRYGVSPFTLLSANGLSPDYHVKAGERLVIPGAAGAAGATVVAEATETTTVTAEVAGEDASVGAATAQEEVQVASVASQAVQAGETLTDAAPANDPAPRAKAPDAGETLADEGGSGFRWPARGRIVAGFGKQPNGERNDGINLALPAGTPVKAAESGTVIYAGDELAGYGNLILIQHEGGWVTAYAHNEDLKVSRGETVRRGQVISTVGSSGSVNQPQLHFELRKGSKPVDPLPHLAGA